MYCIDCGRHFRHSQTAAKSRSSCLTSGSSAVPILSRLVAQIITPVHAAPRLTNLFPKGGHGRERRHRSAHRVRSPDLQTAENCQMYQFNGGSSTRACGQIDSYRFPHDLHGPHSSQSNTKTSRDWLGIEMGDQSGHPRNLLPSYLDRY